MAPVFVSVTKSLKMTMLNLKSLRLRKKFSEFYSLINALESITFKFLLILLLMSLKNHVHDYSSAVKTSPKGTHCRIQ